MAEEKKTIKKTPAKKTTTKKVVTKKVEAPKKEAKFCQYCGAEMSKDAEACMKCGKFTADHKSAPSPDDSTKLYKILSYLGILWIVGLLVEQKNDKRVKFHVGQGILITIIWVIIALINNLIIANVFTHKVEFYWYSYRETSGLGYAIMWILWLIPTALSIIGIVNVIKNEDKELPVIGKYAFYK